MRIGVRLTPSLTAKIVTLFVALTAFANPATAGTAPLCAELFAFETSPLGRVTKHLDAKTPYSAREFEEHLESIDQLLGPLARPEETQIRIGSEFAKSSLDRVSFDLYAGLRKEIYKSGKMYPPGKNLAILTHEYGHAILEKNLLVNSEAYRKAKPDFLQTDEARKALRELNLQKFEKTQKSSLVISALHEFFADAVAITRHQDPNAITDIIKDYQKPATDGSFTDLLTRDFNPSTKGLHEKNWEKFSPLAIFVNDVYYVMLPARWEFWQLVKTRIDSPGYRAQILPKVYKAVEKVVEDVLAWNPQQVQGPRMTPEQMKQLNQRLIEELRASL